VTTFNQDAWELISEWVDKNPPVRSFSQIWIPQPEPCPALLETLGKFDPAKIRVLQSFKPFYNSLQGLHSGENIPGKVSLVLCVPTRQKVESLGLIAQGILNLADEGVFVLACANAQGASSFISKLKSVVENLEVESGNKCKWTVFKKSQLRDTEILQQWLNEAGPTQVGGTSFESLPGIYGWNKIDRGSLLLASTLPPLQGRGADFGCGWGFLSHCVLSTKTNSVERLYALEADERALASASRNLSSWSDRCEILWVDIAGDSEELSKLPPLDWIVMNPPFHEGRDTEAGLGKIFIEKAAAKLRPGGQLFLVANSFLPYEETLKAKFKKVQRVLDAEGFKVIHAQR
jgi:16S rRNA (guanine1207-N2)-methyltransferase